MRIFALLLFSKVVFSASHCPPNDLYCENQQLQRTNQVLSQALRSLNSGVAVGQSYGQSLQESSSKDTCPPNSPNEVNKYYLKYSQWHGPGVAPGIIYESKYESRKHFDPTGKNFMWTNADYVSWWNVNHNPFIGSLIPAITSIPRTNWASVKDMVGCPDKIAGLLMEGADRFKTENGTLPDFQCFYFPRGTYGCNGRACTSVRYVHLRSMGKVEGSSLENHIVPAAGCNRKSNAKYQEDGACRMCTGASGKHCYGICVDGSRDATSNAKSIVTVLGTM